MSDRSGSRCPTAACARSPPGTTARQIAESDRRRAGPRGAGRPGRTARSGISTARSRRDAPLAILTERDPDALELLRHSSAHILATAVRELFPGAGIGFGPPIEDGFYYDFQVDRPFTPEDLERIEAKMARGGQRGLPVRARGGGPRRGQPALRRRSAQARAHRASSATTRPSRSTPTARSSTSAAARTSRAPAGSSTSSCCTPPAPTGGATSSRQMLQRIYGTAWFKKEDLDAYLHRLEEARKRDHRRLGKELDLFSISGRRRARARVLASQGSR